jgi:hypothetical protein
MQSFKTFLTERESTGPSKGVSVHGIHYSNKSGLSSLDGRYSGTGIKGAEGKRLQWTKDERIKKRSYFYNKEPHETLPKTHEQGLGPHAHSATLHNIYDPEKAAPEHRQEIRATSQKHVYDGEDDSNAFERAVVDHGYNGYTHRGMTVVLNHDHVPVKYEGHRSDLLK